MFRLAQKTVSLSQQIRYNYIEPSCYNLKHKINPVISVTLSNKSSEICTIDFRLFENVVPKTTQNFKRLFLGTAQYGGRTLSLINNPVHQYIPRAYIQFGHFPQGNCSIFGPTFRDESFELLHDRPALLSCISEQNTCNSRFALTVAPCPFMDHRNTIFGEVTAQTIDALKKLEQLGAKGLKGVFISKTYQIPRQQKYIDQAHQQAYLQ